MSYKIHKICNVASLKQTRFRLSSSIQWVPGALSLGVKRPGREADNPPPSNAEVKNAWSYTSTPLIRLQGVVLG
jgi:hypothetical protein